MNQIITSIDGRRFLVESHEVQTVTELIDSERGAEVTGLLASEAISLAEEIRSARGLPHWPQTDLSAELALEFELATEAELDPMVHAAIAFTVQRLLADPDKAEQLDRMRTPGRAA